MVPSIYAALHSACSRHHCGPIVHPGLCGNLMTGLAIPSCIWIAHWTARMLSLRLAVVVVTAFGCAAQCVY